jgi:glyoxylase-like metal-dependent hydrolase (beta-lactamase superfamily II)
MTYEGAVPGGGGLRVLDEVEIRKVTVGPMDNAVYLLTCRASGEQLLVDAADEPERLLALVREGSRSGRLDVVVTTHAHADHHAALASIHAVTGALHVCGAADAAAVPVPAGRQVQHGDVLTVGHLTLDVIGLRGHTPGSIALAYREPQHAAEPGSQPARVHLFTGDSLFPGGPGRTTSREDFTALMGDVSARLFDRFGDDTWVYPGHGRDTTLGAERPALPHWRRRGW